MKRYKFYNAVVHRTVNGHEKQYKICDVCGAETCTDYGYNVSLRFKGFEYDGRRGMCPKCAAEFLPHLSFAIDGIETLIREKKMDAKTDGFLLGKQWVQLGWNVEQEDND